ncbi:DODA-type extradiol aromatic ring-opening family dioxygenase [Alicyclobacillus cycloheptanicus]|uniref:3,4-dihydroxyphenylacetate 2,3-dioxygenase n=1 Tax=Alicyclobacillus cycloheptanicus TaxID=1457 RepID=A0ABT9XIZ1_9BACL|nr:extradiol ring-cleavage dioxygenase [Alicyclobacillus cycloheptanicus]MDQ0190284.1 3,4-dihydroxyphenylacetate 2,3-dioxygenase [Alicyclobacillus cycloheptanicus]
MSLELAMISPHTPRICHRDKVADFQQPMVEAMLKTADIIDGLKPDVLVLVSCHWMSSFEHYVDAAARHKGILTAFECPDVISDVPYDHPGCPELAHQMVKAGVQAGLSVQAVDDPTYVWDYGTVVPLRYLLKDKTTPVIDLSVCWAASLEETMQWGHIIGEVIAASPLKVVFVASGALAHNLRRGPSNWPNLTEQALDREFCNHLVAGELANASDMLASYARAASVESGGRHVAMLLGVLQGGKYTGVLHGYGPSSGSGNPVLTLHPVSA